MAIKFITNNTASNKVIHESAMDILKPRYARGEIDDEEFDRRKKELMK
ncbi:MAG: SHOCT domain-containing protein [Gammaproteobacteria bacterium]